ncbi:helix-turn-helix domain-containing protein [Parahaliea mediterranea]|uniref:Helix-turn-helix transcriptional regulator n=1 Tax=Parahaliea mediterranea TaxID=651086 RepID=A0A939DEL8_9GAMM|nr:AraC family transcriptional regulator [Parahaliea mediterranea]MBN7796077.1 helix-turn-helix transcriptional regulator [Parahaliea mediterranea]
MDPGDRIVSSLSSQAPAASIITNAERSVVLVRSFFPATEGVEDFGAHLKMGLCISGGGTVKYNARGRLSTLNWHPGDFLVRTPLRGTEFASPDVDMLGLAIEPSAAGSREGICCALEELDNIPSRVVRDEVIRSVLVAIWTCAEYHGPSSAFIDEGIDIILRRVTTQRGQLAPAGNVRALNQRQIGRVREYVLGRIAHDIRVPELAAALGMEPRRFSRALRAATGVAPYSYLVGLRMIEAKRMLDDGKNVIDTALCVGYQNPGKFSAAFRRVVGCTPSQWRGRR